MTLATLIMLAVIQCGSTDDVLRNIVTGRELEMSYNAFCEDAEKRWVTLGYQSILEEQKKWLDGTFRLVIPRRPANIPTLRIAKLNTVSKTLMPNEAEVALSLRTANDQDSPFDYELSIGGEWTNLEIEVAYEREKGIEYFNYSIIGGNKFIGDWDIEYETRIHDAAGIDRQKLAMMYKAGSWSLGGGMVTSGYTTPLDPVYSVQMDIPSGKLDITTDFSDIHIWKAVIEHTFGKDDIRPFVRGNLVSDNGNMFYKLKFGVKFSL